MILKLAKKKPRIGNEDLWSVKFAESMLQVGTSPEPEIEMPHLIDKFIMMLSSPPFNLDVTAGSPIMMLRIITTSDGLYNKTRLRMELCGDHVS